MRLTRRGIFITSLAGGVFCAWAWQDLGFRLVAACIALGVYAHWRIND